MPPLRLLVTGPPGTGKTTLCANVYKKLATLPGCAVDGFLTVERRNASGTREGFDCVSLDGSRQAPLARVDGPYTGNKVGKYHVQVKDLEQFTLPILDEALRGTSAGGHSLRSRIFIFDEIGKMEMMSSDFALRVQQLLESPDPDLQVLGTVAMSGGGLISQSKRTPGVEIVGIEVRNRDSKAEEVTRRLLEAIGNSGGSQGSCSDQPTPLETAPAGGSGGNGKRRWRAKAKLTPGSGGGGDGGAGGGSKSSEPELGYDASALPPGGRAMAASMVAVGATDARALAAGKAMYGQLGRGTGAQAKSSGDARPVTGLDCLPGDVVAASCGFEHSALVIGGTLVLFGQNHRGQCGQPSTGQREDKCAADYSEDMLVPSVPAGLPAGLSVIGVSCGGNHTVALLEGGDVWACGDNSSGQLGLGASAPKFSSTFCRCAKLSSASSIAAGYKHSAAVCGRRLYTWGNGKQGQLGIGGRRGAPEPQTLDLGVPVRAAALGRWHSLVLTVDDAVWGFGWGRFGVLGQGDMVDHPRPVRIEGLPSPVHLVVSGAVHCGAVCGQERRCFVWGRGMLGRLGLGSEANALRPQPLPGLEGVAALALGGDFSAARAGDGLWLVWGKGEEGQLAFGDADRGKRLSPTPSSALGGRTQAAVGDCHVLAF